MKKSLLLLTSSLILALSLFFAAPSSALALTGGGDEPPAWLQQVVQTGEVPFSNVAAVPAAVLHHEQIVTVGEDGHTVTTTMYAVRILRREGKRAALAREIYLTNGGKVRELRAWLWRSGKFIKKYGKDETVDVALANNDIYNEYRAKGISAMDEADAGDVFGFQVTSENNSVFSQDSWDFQDGFGGGALPGALSRYTLNLPAGWRAESVTFNHAKIEPTVSSSSYTWELRNLRALVPEPMSPEMDALVPRVAVSYFPADGARTALKTFRNWQDVATWMAELEDPQVTLNDPLAAKARELTANAKTEFEKIQAIGRYVQNIQYISIQTNLGRGGGYRPHSAVEIFAKNYGDCKDKATLMRAMLRAVGITSYAVSIYAGDPSFVRAEWASPQQFNHCIIAVKVSDETVSPTVVAHPQLGRLLIFDATDDTTPVGDLPDHEQGSFALIDAKETLALTQMPVTPPESNRLEREAEVELAADGSVTAKLRERSTGYAAVRERSLFRAMPRGDYDKVIENWIAGGVAGARVSKIETADAHNEGRFALDVEFASPAYAQLMQGRLMMFKPSLVARSEALDIRQGGRMHPIMLRAQAYKESVRVKLPAGFIVDELPETVKLESPFGVYQMKCEVKDGVLIFERNWTQRTSTVAPDDYNRVKEFFTQMRAAEQTPVVLIKK